jgi:glucose-1-phosphate adenylyltransferase
LSDAHHFGIAETAHTGRIRGWIEKPKKPQSNLASMGIYVFNTGVLTKALTEITKKNCFDFAENVIPHLLKKHHVFGFEFKGYWRDVGTIEAYRNANMDLLTRNAAPGIENWRIKTNLHVKGEIGDRPSALFGRTARVSNSLIARGCIIEGKVDHSVLSPGVHVRRGAVVSDSIIFHDTVIGTGAIVAKSIIDKSVTISSAAQIGCGKLITNKRFPQHLSTGITVIGKKACIASNVKIGKNCIVNPEVAVKKNLSSGKTI